MIIYKITNMINNRCYIGQTIKSLDRRKSTHICNARCNQSNTIIAKAINKYGSDKFTWEVLEECKTLDELNNREEYWIDHLNTHVSKGGYNIKYGGNNYSGWKWCENHPNEDHGNKGNNHGNVGENHYNYGKPCPDNVKNRLSFLYKGEGNPFYGKKHIDDVKIKMKQRSKLVKIVYQNGKVEIVKGLSDWCKDNNINYSGMKRVVQGKQYLYKNIHCEYI